MRFKLSNLNSNFALIPGYLNPALNNPALMIKSAGKIVYDTDNIHNVTFVKNLLEYSDDFSTSVAKNSLWYLDTDGTTANINTDLKQESY